MNFLLNFFSPFIQPDPKTALLVVLNLIVIESLLSLDNAAVLATLVMNLPEEKRKRALRIGAVFAYIFRGLALISANLLIKINWLKLLGGGYLLYLFADFFYSRLFKKEPVAELDEDINKARRKAAKKIPGLNFFWSTVVMVELMDLTFSIDNVFAAVAFTKNIYLICTGVFIGIITMRIVAGYFVKLMEIFPFLEALAFIVIGVLGARLCLDFICTYFPGNVFCTLIQGEKADFRFSILTVIIFFTPILTSLVFNFPKRRR